MPIFGFDKALAVARDARRALLNLRSGSTRGVAPDTEKQRMYEQGIKREISRLKSELRAAKEQRTGSSERLKTIKSKRQEIFRLKNELLAAKGQLGSGPDDPPATTSGEPAETGALPDFVVIGAQKCGTTSLYHLLTRHPHVEPAAAKELHFFGESSEGDIEWYRRCFPQPRWKDGRKTITGEATPGYIFHPSVPEQMAKVVPQARLIALLRNPVDRAYSQYHQKVRKGGDARSFEEAVEAEMTWLLESSGHERRAADHAPGEYLTRGLYADQLARWSGFFGDEQMLVLKSERFFEQPRETLREVLGFLGLPEWEPESLEIRKQGGYERGLDPALRRRIEEFFEPHNRRLYERLGVDLGW